MAKPKKPHRPMPEDPRLLAKAMFEAADRKIEEKRAAEKAAPEPPRRKRRAV